MLIDFNKYEDLVKKTYKYEINRLYEKGIKFENLNFLHLSKKFNTSSEEIYNYAKKIYKINEN